MTKTDRQTRLIVGHVGPDNAKIWGRGNAKNSVMFLKATSGDESVTQARQLSPADGYAGTISLSNLEANTEYALEVSYGSTERTPKEERVFRQRGEFETTPESDKSEPFSMLLNSCNFHGWGPIRSNDKANIRRTQVAEGVDMVLHTGDQVYADKSPLSFSVSEFRKAYEKAWSDEGVPELLSSHANYMIADDHEVVNGYLEGGKLTKFQRLLLWLRGHGKEKGQQYREMAQNGARVFEEFQRSHAPTTHGKDANYYTFEHGTHKFFALDTGLNRDPAAGKMISAEQQAALFDWLLEERDKPKFIMTSTPFIMEYKNPEDKWTSPEWNGQREEIIDFLAQNKLDKVVFLAGDVHASGHAKLTLQGPDGGSFVIDELTSSAVNASIMRGREKFVGSRQGKTAQGTPYKVELDEESFLGKGGRFKGISNSNVMRIDVDGDAVEYSIFRTRHGEEDAVRKGSFHISG